MRDYLLLAIVVGLINPRLLTWGQAYDFPFATSPPHGVGQ